MTLADRILALLATHPGLSDREITDQLLGKLAPQQPVNQAARRLEGRGFLRRERGADGRIRNHLLPAPGPPRDTPIRLSSPHSDDALLSEDEVKKLLEKWLRDQGWSVRVRWWKDRGIDIDAHRGDERWIVEVKGGGSLQPMRVNYFLAVLGELLQRMDDPNARYSIALPEMRQFRRLWERLPNLAKQRSRITALFVASNGRVERVP